MTITCAAILLEPSATRDRLTVDIFHPTDGKGIARLDRAFALVTAAQPVRDRLRNARVRDLDEARKRGLIDDAETEQLKAADQAVADVIAVDDFAADELSPHHRIAEGDLALPTTSEFRRAAGQ